MTGSDPLRILLSRYRKRKQLSIRGFAPGIEYSSFRRGFTRTPNTGHISQHNHDEYRTLSNADEYDPGRAFYQQGGPHYHPHDRRQDFEVAPARPIRFPASREWSSLRVPPVNTGLADTTTDDIDIHALFDTSRDAARSIAEARAHFETMEAYGNSIMVGDAVDEFIKAMQIEEALATINYFFPTGMDASFNVESHANLNDAPFGAEAEQRPMSELSPEMIERYLAVNAVGPDDLPSSLAALGNDALEMAQNQFGDVSHQFGETQPDPSLEQFVEDEMQQLDPYAQMDPFGMTNYGPMPLAMMPGMPMDPFGPIPPGLGPM